MAAQGFAFTQYNKLTPFEAWIESEGIPIIRELVVRDLRNVEFELAHNTIAGHISEGRPCVYRKAHRHGPGAFIFVLEGKGYSLMWPEGGTMKRYDWGSGSLFTPPNRWFHQHFTTSKEPVKRLALKGWGQKYPIGGWDLMATGTDEGGDMIEYENENSRVREMYEEELAMLDMKLQMSALSNRAGNS